MTRQRSFKRLVRARMEKTGEAYSAARAALLAGRSGNGTRAPQLATSDAAIRERTGRGWEEWFDLLDAQGATDMTHRDIARWLAAELGIDPLAWNAQAITHSYELTRGMREEGERDGGFAATVTRTIAAPPATLFDAVLEPARLGAWQLRERTSTRPRSARFDHGDGGARVHLTFAAKGDARATVTVDHRRLPDAAAAKRAKALWRERLDALRTEVERP